MLEEFLFYIVKAASIRAENDDIEWTCLAWGKLKENSMIEIRIFGKIKENYKALFENYGDLIKGLLIINLEIIEN